MTRAWCPRVIAAAWLIGATITVAGAQYGEDETPSATELDEAFSRAIAADPEEGGEVHSLILGLLKEVATALHEENLKTHEELAELRGEVASLRDEIRHLAGRQP